MRNFGSRPRFPARVSVRWQVTVLMIAVSLTGLTLLVATREAEATILNYTDPTISAPNDITTGPDGALWFTNPNGSIGRISTAGVVTNFPTIGMTPLAITVGSDSALWFTDSSGNSIGRITTSGVVTNHTDPLISTPGDITAGPDGALWFTNVNNSIGRITTGGVVTSFPAPAPIHITAGPDGALWFTSVDSAIRRMTTGGVVTTFPDPSISSPGDIAAGPDGALWFTNYGNDSIGRITTGGVVTQFTDASIVSPYGITSGPDGALWFTMANNASIGRITTGGVVTRYTDATISGPLAVAAGSNGAMWWTNSDSIGSMPLHVPGAPTVTIAKSGDRSIQVSFTPGADGSPSTTGYVASCQPTGAGTPGTMSGPVSPIVVRGLTNGDAYTCTVHGVNVEGNGPASAPSGVVTPSTAVLTVACSASTCPATVPSTASVSTPGQTVHITGVPSSPIGSIKVSTSLGTLGCPAVGPRLHRITKLTDKGFSPRKRLHVTVTLRITSATSPEGVCFNSAIPFFSEQSPAVKTAGTAMLLTCAGIRNVPPCVTSSKQVGANIVVKFVVPGGDPRFYVALPRGRQAWLGGPGIAKVGRKYSAHMETVGGTAPFRWKVTRGKPPVGLALNASTGLISGKPTKKGKWSFVLQATDSTRPPQSARVNVPMVVK